MVASTNCKCVLIEAQPKAPPVDDPLRRYFLRRRESLLMELREIEDMLGLEHSRQTKREAQTAKDSG